MADQRQTIIQAAAAIRSSEPRSTVARSAERALRGAFGLSDEDGIYGTSRAAEAMGYRGQPDDVDLFDVIAKDVGKRIANVEPAPFRVELADRVIEVSTRSDDMGGIVAAFAASDGIKPVLKDIAESAYYSKYDGCSWSEMDEGTAANIAHALFEGGVDRARQCVIDLVNEYSEPDEISDYIKNNLMEETRYGLGGLVEALCDALEELDPDTDRDEAKDAFLEEIGEELGDLIADSDKSEPFDIISDHVRVEVVCLLTPKSGEFHEDELVSDFEGNVCGVGTIHPGPALLGLFERTNLPFAAFVDLMERRTGIRLDAGPDDDALVEWLVSEDYLHSGDDARESARRRAAAWASFAPSTDPATASAIDPEGMFHVITESSYSGHPVHVSRMDLKALVTRDWSLPMSIQPYAGYGGKNGGFVGIYNPSNGSGYIDLADAPVTVPAGTENWRVSGKWGYRVDKSFGMVESYYYAVPADAPAPAADPDADAAPGLGM